MERRITLEGGLLSCDLGGLEPSRDGQVLECRLHLTDILPERRVAVAVSAAECAPDGTEHPRGRQFFTVPPHHGREAQDVSLEGVTFLFPSELDVSQGGPRRVVLRAVAHYVDGNERCLLA